MKFIERKTLRTGALVGCGLTLVLAAGAHAQSATPVADDSLTFHGITLSGNIDIGLQYDNHGSPESDYHPAGTNPLIAKQDNGSITAVIPSGLTQSKVTLSGKEPIGDEVYAVFRLETFFNPQAGTISDALKALTINNGVALAAQTMAADSSIAGQAFNGAAYAGIGSKRYGTITFGRQTSLVADGVGTYDPMSASQAFSVIGMSGTYAGGGDTQDRRFDDSIKYLIQVDHLRAGALYKFSQTGGEANSAYSFQLGASAGNGSIDVYYEKVHSAVAASSLSASQVTALATTCPGCTLDKTLAATVSDNRTISVMGSYRLSRVKLFGAYEHIRYENPRDPLTGASGAAYNDIGGYLVPYALMNQGAYADPKQLNVVWAGAQVAVTSRLSIWLAFYNVHQNSYATGANAGCTTSTASNCSGDLAAYSAAAIYSLGRHFDLYAGLMASHVTNGFASGYLQTEEVDPTAGVRLKF